MMDLAPSSTRAGTMSAGDHPSSDESFDRLHRAGWSVGEVATASGWLVTGTNGENAIHARGATQAEAWWEACEQARVVGQESRLLRVEPPQVPDFLLLGQAVGVIEVPASSNA